MKMEFKEIGCDLIDWLNVAQSKYTWRALVNTVVKLWF
jgi:hypothetical protein